MDNISGASEFCEHFKTEDIESVKRGCQGGRLTEEETKNALTVCSCITEVRQSGIEGRCIGAEWHIGGANKVEIDVELTNARHTDAVSRRNTGAVPALTDANQKMMDKAVKLWRDRKFLERFGYCLDSHPQKCDEAILGILEKLTHIDNVQEDSLHAELEGGTGATDSESEPEEAQAKQPDAAAAADTTGGAEAEHLIIPQIGSS
ncbi:hypothetical protein C8J57DRAFT_1224784 [Mycena rebaudengoi]|nr:hypothetical protein C8J57DRAFT_1224784 [Mycena rebaudengoi]